jgi:exonuclease III
MRNCKANNVGWRLDYFVVSERIYDKVATFDIHKSQNESDHVPISMAIRI